MKRKRRMLRYEASGGAHPHILTHTQTLTHTHPHRDSALAPRSCLCAERFVPPWPNATLYLHECACVC